MTQLIDALLNETGTVLVFCDGGLANRINSLIGGLVVAERLRRHARILWPRSNRCGAALGEVFEVPQQAFEVRLQDLVPHADRLQLWPHEDDVGFGPAVRPLRALGADGEAAARQIAAADARPVLYSENQLLPWFTEAEVRRVLLCLRLRPEILAQAREVIARAGPGFVGIHLRATDFTQPPPLEPMLAMVRRPAGHKFFVCSDDASIEARFAAEPSVVTHAKTAYVDKRVDGPWRSAVTDSDGLPYGSNIERNAASVVQAAVDLLVLAASVPVRTSSSSFLALAERLRSSGWVQRHLLPPVPAAVPVAAPEEAPVTQQEVLDLLALLRPHHMASDHKVRLGGDADGGYVMPSLARKSNLVLSIGIGDQVSFDSELADLGATVLQFDHTIPGQPLAHPNIRFHGLGWGPVDDGALRSLKTMVAMTSWGGVQHAILKFDVEGAEWDALQAADSADLARFDVVAGEFHWFQSMDRRDAYQRIRAVIEKLRLTHVPVHLHANNATGIKLVLGVPVPPLLEITWVRRGVVVTAGHSTDPIPGPLDRPNVASRPDLCLRPF